MRLLLTCLLTLATPLLHAKDITSDDIKVYKELEKAQEIARSTDAPVYLEFMSSQCPHCQAYHKNVVNDPKFIEYANQNLVPVFYDYADMNSLPEAERAARTKLMKKLNVTGFPTVFLMASDGTILLRSTGYDDRSAKEMIQALEKAATSRSSSAS